MPRSIPGTYAITPYDQFVKNLYAIDLNGNKYKMTKDASDAPRWNISDSGKQFLRFEYEVDLHKMERKLAAADASIARTGFASLLNYSILGWIEGTINQEINCEVLTFKEWPIFSTIHPSSKPAKTTLHFKANNYKELADAQLYLGPRFKVKEFMAEVPLFIVSYCETKDEYLDDYGWQGKYSMGILKNYFQDIPFKHYSILLRKVLPLEAGSVPAFGMEHLQSSTFFGDTSQARFQSMSDEEKIATIPTYIHHMAHSYIPLRSYGDNYKPYAQEIPPIINNIWFNEGFMWFLPYDTLRLVKMKNRFIKNVYNTAPEIMKMSLQQLSQTASTMYAVDFRLGTAIYARGALMAIEMNDYLKEKSGGKKSMKDVLRYLYEWSKNKKRAFTLEEFPLLINQACGIDLTAIYQKWQAPIEKE